MSTPTHRFRYWRTNASSAEISPFVNCNTNVLKCAKCKQPCMTSIVQKKSTASMSHRASPSRGHEGCAVLFQGMPTQLCSNSDSLPLSPSGSVFFGRPQRSYTAQYRCSGFPPPLGVLRLFRPSSICPWDSWGVVAMEVGVGDLAASKITTHQRGPLAYVAICCC